MTARAHRRAVLAAAMAVAACAGRFGGATSTSTSTPTPTPTSTPTPTPTPPPRAAAPGAQRVLPVPRAPDTVAPPADRPLETPAVPPPPDPLAPPGNPGAPATATADCVDRALARRGLNAYGDPPGTVYPVDPPVAASSRIARVLARHPELRTACEVPQAR